MIRHGWNEKLLLDIGPLARPANLSKASATAQPDHRLVCHTPIEGNRELQWTLDNKPIVLWTDMSEEKENKMDISISQGEDKNKQEEAVSLAMVRDEQAESKPLRLLIAPMAVAAETGGPFIRARTLAVAAKEQGHVVAFCAAEDPNYRPVEGVANYVAPVPSPFGTPLPLGKILFRVALFWFRNHEMPVTSFEQALHIIGATTNTFFARDVQHLRLTIRTFRPDIVFAVERPAAIVAAKLEHVRVLTSYSLPMGKAFASNPEYSKGVNSFLQANYLPQVESVLDLFEWADRKVVPSSPELEPLSEDNVVYVGPFQSIEKPAVPVPFAQRKGIVAYMGSGGISPRHLIHTLSEAFAGTEYEIYVATKEVKPFTRKAMHVDRWFDFDKLLPDALVYVHHGGQNSIISGLLYGVPQIVCAGGKHFERQYNASSVEQVQAGVCLDTKDFTPEKLRDLVRELKEHPSYAQHAREAGEKLLNLGGVSRVVEILQDEVAQEGVRDHSS
jgi:UDP:flavonoid glycosyltransferase YjiC (YdhE family)